MTGKYAQVLHYSGRDYRRILTCVRVPVEWLKAWRARLIADGGRVLAVYRERHRNGVDEGMTK